MQLQEVITRYPEITKTGDSITDATLIMQDCQIGFLPVASAFEAMALKGIAKLIVTDISGKIIGVLTSGDTTTVCKGDNTTGQLTQAIHMMSTQQLETPPQDAQFVSD